MIYYGIPAVIVASKYVAFAFHEQARRARQGVRNNTYIHVKMTSSGHFHLMTNTRLFRIDPCKVFHRARKRVRMTIAVCHPHTHVGAFVFHPVGLLPAG